MTYDQVVTRLIIPFIVAGILVNVTLFADIVVCNIYDHW